MIKAIRIEKDACSIIVEIKSVVVVNGSLEAIVAGTLAGLPAIVDIDTGDEDEAKILARVLCQGPEGVSHIIQIKSLDRCDFRDGVWHINATT